MNAEDHPGAPLPPPLIHAVALIAGYGVDWLWPLPLPGATWHYAAGALLVALAVAVVAAALGTLRRHGTTVNPRGSASALVADGPFRFSRNPIYVGLVLAHLGIALLLGGTWMLLTVVPAVVVMDRLIIAGEERYLTRRFGSVYQDYCRRVRRWL